MNLIIQSQQQATQELESILKQAGWCNGKDMQHDKQLMQDINKPLYYKQTSPSYASSVQMLRKSGYIRQVNLFAVYGQIDSPTINADNRAQVSRQQYALVIYYDNPNIFTTNNQFIGYIDNFMTLLENHKWVIQDNGESAVEANDTADTWSYKRDYIISKFFCV